MITQCLRSPKRVTRGLPALRVQVFENTNSDVVAAASQLSQRRVETQASVRPETRPNADSTINLLTLGDSQFSLHCQANNLGTHGLSSIATFGELHAITRNDVVAETRPPRGFPRNTSVGTGCGATSRIDVLQQSEKVDLNSKGHNCDGESKDENVRTHSVSLHCRKWGRILRRGVSRRGKRRRGNRMSMRPSGVSTHNSRICVRRRH